MNFFLKKKAIPFMNFFLLNFRIPFDIAPHHTTHKKEKERTMSSQFEFSLVPDRYKLILASHRYVLALWQRVNHTRTKLPLSEHSCFLAHRRLQLHVEVYRNVMGDESLRAFFVTAFTRRLETAKLVSMTLAPV